MTLTPGTRLGPYEIVVALGVGGMGEVYRARDTKLNRNVAIKVLPDSFAADPDRLARFTREAQTLASLNHPYIAHIYGLERQEKREGRDEGSAPFLVMELVEGEDLSQRIARGAIPFDEALPIAKQIAEALEAAHEQGIIHRDLKPANVKVREDGTVKVLDFGLAKAMDPLGSSQPVVSQSPTITTPAMTLAGMILGTAAYMSPEQARGKPVDKRTDVWAFGAVLYEMLAAARAFDGEDSTEVIAAVVKTTPNWAALPADVPAPIVTLIQRCLEKDRKARIGDMAVARFLLADHATLGAPTIAATNITSAAAPRWRRALPWTVAGALAAGFTTALVLWAPWHPAPEPARVAFDLQTAATPTNLSRMLAISPDGTHVVTPVQDGAVTKLWVRQLARLEGATLARTDGAVYPFWSPDGHAIGFFADGKLKTVDLSGASPQTIADVQEGYGGTWNKAGVILYARQFDAIYRVAADGRSAVPVTELDATRGDVFHRYPRFLPDGVHFLFLVRSSNSDANGIYVASLASKETHKLVDALTKPEFAPPNLLLFARESMLMGQRLDTSSFRAIGAPFRVVEPMSSNTTSGSAAFSVSDNDVLAYRAGFGGDVRDLAWVDRNGTRGVTVGATAGYLNPRLSPDGKRLAVFKPENGGDIWVTDLERGGASARFTLDPANDDTPLWSRDGTRIAFVSNRDGGIFNIYQKNAGGTGSEELLLKTPRHKQLNDWSRDDQYLVYEEDDPQTKTDLWMLPLGGDRMPSRILASPFNESEATLSPDGHWMAYTSDESGARQVYVQKFPTSDRKWPVSSGRVGAHARWSPLGDELFFDGGGIMFAVSVTGLEPGGEFRLGPPKRLFDGLLSLAPHNFDVLDAGRFLVMLAPETGTGTAPITIVMNWQSGLSLAR